MQLSIIEGGFGFLNLELYHHAYFLIIIGVNFPIWATLESTDVASFLGWTALRSKYSKLWCLSRVRKLWNLIKKRSWPFFSCQIDNLKNCEKDSDMEKLDGNRDIDLDQLIRWWTRIFNIGCVNKYHLSDIA